ncbi:MAG: MliC family protein [Campylobacteraceae bacterium]|jgi:outer membrane lipoprotein SlyB|nr:MliC family protein [Campylobacteraceae bacterium]
MKKRVMSIAAVLLLLSGCNGKSNTVDAVIKGDDGSVIYIVFENDSAKITLPNGEKTLLKGVPTASGSKYANDQYEYSEWHGEIELKKDGEVIFKTKQQ